MAAPAPVVYVPRGIGIQWDDILHMPVSEMVKIILFILVMIIIIAFIVYKARKKQNLED